MNDKLENNKLDDNNLEKVSGGANPGMDIPEEWTGMVIEKTQEGMYVVDLGIQGFVNASYTGNEYPKVRSKVVVVCNCGSYYIKQIIG